jgi:hypothetical protein
LFDSSPVKIQKKIKAQSSKPASAGMNNGMGPCTAPCTSVYIAHNPWYTVYLLYLNLI